MRSILSLFPVRLHALHSASPPFTCLSSQWRACTRKAWARRAASARWRVCPWGRAATAAWAPHPAPWTSTPKVGLRHGRCLRREQRDLTRVTFAGWDVCHGFSHWQLRGDKQHVQTLVSSLLLSPVCSQPWRWRVKNRRDRRARHGQSEVKKIAQWSFLGQ